MIEEMRLASMHLGDLLPPPSAPPVKPKYRKQGKRYISQRIRSNRRKARK